MNYYELLKQSLSSCYSVHKIPSSAVGLQWILLFISYTSSSFTDGSAAIPNRSGCIETSFAFS